MADEITPEIFDHLVGLAALELSGEEGEYLRRQLNNQLKAIHELEAIPLEGAVPPSLHGVAYPADRRQPLRPDEWKAFGQPGEIIAGAPHAEDGYIAVPEIPHTELE